jgi:hypothetical protein
MPKSSYPGLFDRATKKLHALLGSASFVIGRSETADVPVLDLGCSRQQFRKKTEKAAPSIRYHYAHRGEGEGDAGTHGHRWRNAEASEPGIRR